MNLNIKKNKTNAEIAECIASVINEQIRLGKNVLWFISGGSAVPLEVLIAQKIGEIPEGKLVITLTDERYGDIDHKESNCFKLKTDGFEIKGAKYIPFLCGKDILNTTSDIIQTLTTELEKAEYKIGLFGIGADGHTAGILPQSEAIKADYLVYTYDAPPFKRMTITPKTILSLNEAFIYAVGESKWPTIEKLKLDDISINDQPAQILKSIPLLTIFTDSK